jgi:hypothetical protein
VAFCTGDSGLVLPVDYTFTLDDSGIHTCASFLGPGQVMRFGSLPVQYATRLAKLK